MHNKKELMNILNNFKTYYYIRDLFGSDDDAIDRHILELLKHNNDAYNAYYDTLDKHTYSTIGISLDALDNALKELEESDKDDQ